MIGSEREHSKLTACGIAAGPVFIGAILIQAFTRRGFNLTHLPLSLLSLGDLGWIQVTNFVVTGILIVGCAVGMSGQRKLSYGAVWGPVLIGIYGLGLLAAGVFPPDPAMGFPPGARQGTVMSWHAVLHGIAFFVAHLAVIFACFVFARRFAALRNRGLEAYCAATGVTIPVLIALGFANASIIGAMFFATGVVATGWLAVVAARLVSEHKA